MRDCWELMNPIVFLLYVCMSYEIISIFVIDRGFGSNKGVSIQKQNTKKQTYYFYSIIRKTDGNVISIAQ